MTKGEKFPLVPPLGYHMAEGGGGEKQMTNRSPLLDVLIRKVEAQAAEKPDSLAVLVGELKLVIASDTDPHPLSGALVEGVPGRVVRGAGFRRRAHPAASKIVTCPPPRLASFDLPELWDHDLPDENQDEAGWPTDQSLAFRMPVTTRTISSGSPNP
jgi:hypothetical protein